MVINSATLNRVYQNLRTDFQGAYEGVPRLWTAWGMEVPSSARSNLYHWLSDLPQVREWLGARQAKSLANRSYEVANRDWELTLELNRNDLEDDVEGAVSNAQQRALQIGEEFGFHEDVLMAGTLEAGLTANGFDGQYFFDTDHPVDPDNAGGTTFSNKMTTSALTAATYQTARQNLMSFKRENGLPMPMPSDLLLVVPPALELKARQILEAEYITPSAAIGLANTTGATQNLLRGTAKLQVNPYLTSDTRWFLMGRRGRIAPVLFQRRQAPKLIRKDQETDDNVFERKVYVYGADARYAAGYTFPHLAICADA